MSKETDLSVVESSLYQTINEYNNIPLPDDMSKLTAIQLVTREVKLLADEKKRIFDQKIQEEKFELEKDHRYWSEHFEEKKLEAEKAKNQDEMALKNEEQRIAQERLKLEAEKQEKMLGLEQLRLQIEQSRLEIEKTNLELTEKNRQNEQKFKWISLGLSIGVPALVSIGSLIVYRKLAYSNLKLIYHDEGRPTNDFKDAIKCIQNMTRK